MGTKLLGNIWSSYLLGLVPGTLMTKEHKINQETYTLSVFIRQGLQIKAQKHVKGSMNSSPSKPTWF